MRQRPHIRQIAYASNVANTMACGNFLLLFFYKVKMKMKEKISLLCICIFLNGCGGELSYKQGASAQELTNTKKICQSDGLKTEAEVNKCLETNGWSVHQLDDMDLFAVPSVTSNRQNAQPSEMFLPEDKSAAISNDASASLQKTTSAKNTLETKTDSVADAQKASTKQTSPLDIYTISSWWKMGSSAALLEKNINECVASLGEAHRPNNKTQQVTRGLVVCMHEKSWKALKAK